MATVERIKGGKSLKKKPAASVSDIMARLTPLEEHQDNGVKAVSFGLSGSGKTRFASTHPGRKLLITGFDNNEDGTRSIPRDGTTDVFMVKDAAEADELMHELQHGGLNDRYADGLKILDTGDAAYRMYLTETTGRQLPAQLTFGSISTDEYTAAGGALKEFVMQLKKLPGDFLYIAQERAYGTSEEDGARGINPHVGFGPSEGVYRTLHPAFDYIWRHYADEIEVVKMVKNKETGKLKPKTYSKKEFCLLLGVDKVYKTKFREPGTGITIPELIYDPHWKTIVDIINGTYVDPSKNVT